MSALDKHSETRQLAHDVLHATLHGPLPMATVAQLCTGVIEMFDDLCEELQAQPPNTVTEKLDRVRELLYEAESLVSQCYPSDAHNEFSLALTALASNITKARKCIDDARGAARGAARGESETT